MKLCIWMNTPSPYQEELFRYLARRHDVSLRVIYDSHLGAERKDLGWKVALDGYAHTFLPRPKVGHAIREALGARDSIHVINGIWAVPGFTAALVTLAAVGSSPCFIYSEASDPTRRRHPLLEGGRNAVGRGVAGNKRVHVLAISHMAEKQYAALGFPKERIYRFGYFRAPSKPPAAPARSGSRLLYVGRLMRRKGLDVLLRALEPLWASHPSLALDIIGDGPERASIEGYVGENPEARVSLLGAMPSDTMHDEMAAHDLLVLPSRFDGWGLVVNEALSAGVPALVSDRCGASDLIVQGRNGYVFASEDAASLRGCLSRFLTLKGPGRAAMRDEALRTAGGLHIDAVGDYLVRCIEHAAGREPARPTPPWEHRVPNAVL